MVSTVHIGGRQSPQTPLQVDSPTPRFVASFRCVADTAAPRIILTQSQTSTHTTTTNNILFNRVRAPLIMTNHAFMFTFISVDTDGVFGEFGPEIAKNIGFEGGPFAKSCFL